MAMLVEESTSKKIPPILEKIVMKLDKTTDASCHIEHDLIVAVLYVLIIECGFLPVNTPLDILTKSDEGACGFNIRKLGAVQNMPDIWKNKDVYTISFVLGTLSQYRCRFVALINDADILVVNFVVDGIVAKLGSMSIINTQYVETERLTSEVLASRFKNLKTLSLKFKDCIVKPVKCAILNEEGILNASLLGIPQELKLNILSYLDACDLLNISRICKYFNELSNDQNLWRSIMKKDMIKYGEKNKFLKIRDTANWKQDYKRRVKGRFRLQHYDMFHEDYYCETLPFIP